MSPLARPSTWTQTTKIVVVAAVGVVVVGGAVALSLPRDGGGESASHTVTVRVTGPVNTTYRVTAAGLVDTGSDSLPGEYSQVFKTATPPEALGLVVTGTTYGYRGDVNLPTPGCEVVIDGKQVAHQLVSPARATGLDQFECRVGG